MPTINKTTTLDEAARLTSPAVLREHWMLTVVKTQEFYVEQLIEDHFRLKSPNREYKPNKASYERWKKKYYPSAIYQLVITGRLRNAVRNGKVRSDGTILFNLPEYGLFQIEAGRDFLAQTRNDKKKLSKVFTRSFFDIRKRYISNQ